MGTHGEIAGDSSGRGRREPPAVRGPATLEARCGKKSPLRAYEWGCGGSMPTSLGGADATGTTPGARSGCSAISSVFRVGVTTERPRRLWRFWQTGSQATHSVGSGHGCEPSVSLSSVPSRERVGVARGRFVPRGPWHVRSRSFEPPHSTAGSPARRQPRERWDASVRLSPTPGRRFQRDQARKPVSRATSWTTARTAS